MIVRLKKSEKVGAVEVSYSVELDSGHTSPEELETLRDLLIGMSKMDEEEK